MKVVRVRGSSMWPALKTGDLIFATPVDQEIAPGTLLLRTIEGDIVLHRYLAENLTKGDRFLIADPAGIEDAFVVRRIVLKAFVDRAGTQKFAETDTRFANWLSRLQARFSLRQLRAPSLILKRLMTLALIANGWMIRSVYRLSLQGARDVVPRNK